MVIKGRDHERAKAWALAKAIIQDNEMQSHKVLSACVREREREKEREKESETESESERGGGQRERKEEIEKEGSRRGCWRGGSGMGVGGRELLWDL